MKYSISDLQLMHRRYRMQVLFLLLILVAALVLVFKSRSLTLAALAAAMLFQLFVVRRQQGEYVRAVIQSNLERTLCPKLGITTVVEKGTSRITADLLRRARLMPFRQEHNTPLLRWELSGHLRGFSISLCDTALAQDFQLVERGKKRVHINTGVWIHVDLAKNTGMNFRLLDENSVPTPIRMEFFSQEALCIPSSLDDQELAKCFVLYHPVTDDPPVLSGPFLKKLKKLKEYTPGKVAISVRENQADFFIRNRFLARPVSVRQAPAKELLDFDPFPELSYVLDLADTL